MSNPPILVLEDEPLIAMSVDDELASAGFAVSMAMSCEEANAWLDTATPDIVIVEILLRDGPANDVVSRLIKAEIPFVVHSGDHPDMLRGTPFVEGMWVSKPHAGDELANAARALLAAASGSEATNTRVLPDQFPTSTVGDEIFRPDALSGATASLSSFHPDFTESDGE